MQHFVLTRFNLQIDRWKTSKRGVDVRTPQWLDHRFQMFENYCLPSMLNQSNQNFTWYLLLDQNTPEAYKQRMTSLLAEKENFHFDFIDDGFYFAKHFRLFMKDKISVDDQFVITTRLDNDDMVHHRFIEQIQLLYEPVANTVIDLTKGFQISVDTDSHTIRTYDRPYNHFISLVEPAVHFHTVYSHFHKEWSEADNYQAYDEERLWVELIHSNNFANRTKKKYPRTIHFNNADFGIDPAHYFYEDTTGVRLNNLSLWLRKNVSRILARFSN